MKYVFVISPGWLSDKMSNKQKSRGYFRCRRQAEPLNNARLTFRIPQFSTLLNLQQRNNDDFSLNFHNFSKQKCTHSFIFISLTLLIRLEMEWETNTVIVAAIICFYSPISPCYIHRSLHFSTVVCASLFRFSVSVVYYCICIYYRLFGE